jgi:hypothetical protein
MEKTQPAEKNDTQFNEVLSVKQNALSFCWMACTE